MPQAVTITSGQMWSVAAVAAIVDLVLAGLLTRVLRPPWRPRMALTLLAVCTPGFAALYGWGFWTYWDSCYRFALPAVMKPLTPLVGAVIGALGWVLWQVARRAGRWTIPVFLLLGGLVSLPGHLNGIYRFGLLQHCPMLRSVSPASALVFGVFEFGFYWSVALAISSLLARVVDGRETRGGTRRPPATLGGGRGGS